MMPLFIDASLKTKIIGTLKLISPPKSSNGENKNWFVTFNT